MANDLYVTGRRLDRTIGTGVSDSLIVNDGSYWHVCNKKELRPEKIIFHDRTTIVIWNDGSKTKATCSENDIFDEQIGLASCLLKKMYGKKIHGKKLFDRMLEGAERHKKVGWLE